MAVSQGMWWRDACRVVWCWCDVVGRLGKVRVGQVSLGQVRLGWVGLGKARKGYVQLG